MANFAWQTMSQHWKASFKASFESFVGTVSFVDKKSFVDKVTFVDKICTQMTFCPQTLPYFCPQTIFCTQTLLFQKRNICLIKINRQVFKSPLVQRWTFEISCFESGLGIEQKKTEQMFKVHVSLEQK